MPRKLKGDQTVERDLLVQRNITQTSVADPLRTIKDLSGALDKKTIREVVSGGNYKLYSVKDDDSTKVDNILVVNLESGNIGIGVAPTNSGGNALRIGLTTTVKGNSEKLTAYNEATAGSVDTTIGAKLLLDSDSANTVNQSTIYSEIRRKVSTSTEDTAGILTALELKSVLDPDGGVVTYTHSDGTMGVVDLVLNGIENAGSGSLAISHAAAAYIKANSVVGVTNKYGLYVGTIAGGTNNYAIYTNTGKVRFGDQVLTTGNVTVGTYLSLTPQGAAPGVPTNGDLYYDNTGDHALLLYLNGAWVSIDTSAAGDVQGPAVSVDNSIPVFDGVTGKLIKDPNIAILTALGMVITSAGDAPLKVVSSDEGSDLQITDNTMTAHIRAYDEQFAIASEGTASVYFISDYGNNSTVADFIWKTNSTTLNSPDGTQLMRLDDEGTLTVPRLDSTALVIGNSIQVGSGMPAASSVSIFHGISTGRLVITGDTGSAAGGQFRLYGDAHGSQPSEVEVNVGNTTYLKLIDANKNVKIGNTSAAADSARLHVEGGTDMALLAEMVGSATTGVYRVLEARARCSGNMADGFGGSINFTFEDADIPGAEVNVGAIQVVRDGADNSSHMLLQTYNAGSAGTALKLQNDYHVYVPYGMGIGIVPDAATDGWPLKVYGLWSGNGHAYGVDIKTEQTADSNIGSGQVGLEVKGGRTITTSVTDTNTIRGIDVGKTFSVAAGQTVTNASGILSDIWVEAMNIAGGGAIDYTDYRKIAINDDSVDTGTNKYGIYIGAQTGATNNWQLYSSGTSPSYFADSVRIGTTVPLYEDNAALLVYKVMPSGDAGHYYAALEARALWGTDEVLAGSRSGGRFNLYRTITTDIADTGNHRTLHSAGIAYTVPVGVTYTNNSSSWSSSINAGTPSLVGTGTLAVTNYALICIESSSLNTGTTKTGLRIGAQSGAANNYQIYSEGTAPSYFAGSIDIGGTSNWLRVAGTVGLGGTYGSSNILRIGQANPLSGVIQEGVRVEHNATSAATTSSIGFVATHGTADASFTCSSRVGFASYNKTKGAASTITRDVAFYGVMPTQGVNNALLTDSLSFTGDWGIYLATTNPSYLAGPMQFPNGSAAAPSITFASDPDTGLYRAGADYLGIAGGGYEVAIFSGSATQRWMRLGMSSTGDSIIYCESSDGILKIASGTGSASGGNIWMYGPTHGSKPDYIEFKQTTQLSGYFNTAGDFTVSRTEDAGTVFLNVVNNSNTADSKAVVSISGAGSSAAYSAIRFSRPSNSWIIGQDFQDSDQLKFCIGSVSLSTPVMTFDRSKRCAIGDGSPNINAVLLVTNTSTTETNQRGIRVDTIANSSAIASFYGVAVNSTTNNVAFTCPVFARFYAYNPGKGAASTITRQIAYAGVPQTSGVNNAFLADNIAFTGDYGINLSTTNPSEFAARMGVGGAASANYILRTGSANPLGGTSQGGIATEMEATSNATVRVVGVLSNITTEAAAFTTPYLAQFWAADRSKGAGSSITNKISYGGVMQTGGTNNAFIADSPSFVGDYGIYLETIKNSYIEGTLRVGISSQVLSGSEKLGVRRDYNGTPGDTNLGLAVYTKLQTDDNLTSGSAFAAYIRKDRIVADDVTDTQSGGFSHAGVMVLEDIFYVSSGKTYSSSVFSKLVVSGTTASPGTLSIDNYNGIYFPNCTVATGNRKTAIRLPNVWSGSTYNVLVSDTYPTGDYSIYLSNTNPSYHAGSFYVGINTPTILVNNIISASRNFGDSATGVNSGAIAIQAYFDSDNAYTANSNTGIYSRIRRNITASVTDTGGYWAANAAACRFNIASAQTYSCTGAYGWNGLFVYGPINDGSGILDINDFSGIRIQDSSLDTGTNKYGIYVGTQSGATNNWQIYSSSTTIPSYIGGPVRIGSTSAYGSNEILYVTETYSGGGSFAAAMIRGYSTINGTVSSTHDTLGLEHYRTITSNQTDTGRDRVLALRSRYNVPTGVTLTNNNSTAGTMPCTINIQAPVNDNSTPGTVDFDHFAYLVISSNTHLDTGTNKYAMYIDQIWGATNNYGIYQSYAGNDNYFGGAVRVGDLNGVISDGEKLSVHKTYSGTASGIQIGATINLELNTNNALTSGSNCSIYSRFKRTITDDVTDAPAGGLGAIQNMYLSRIYDVASTKTYTLLASTGMAAIRVPQVSLSGGGSLAVSNMHGIYIHSDSVVTGINKYGLRIGSMSGATNNYQLYVEGDSTNYFEGKVLVGPSPTGVPSGFGNFMLGAQKTYSDSSAASGKHLLSVGLNESSDIAVSGSSIAAGGFLFEREVNANVTDTSAYGFNGVHVDMRFDVGSGYTYTYTNSNGYAGVRVKAALFTDVGDVEVTYYAAMRVDSCSADTGINKYGLYVGGITGATNNYAIATGSGMISFGDPTVSIPNLKSGINQGAAGANAGELWHDTTDDTIKMGV